MSILQRIAGYKSEEVVESRRLRPLHVVECDARNARPPRGFAHALASASRGGYGLIAEIKKASPSKGLIREEFDPQRIARSYQAGGATCISVLTDRPSFLGSSRDLFSVAGSVQLPILRKDFMLDTYQVVEARACRADCILIILAMVGDTQAAELEAAAGEWGMDVLLEVHDEIELDRALQLKSRLVGINNRNLKTFEVSLDVTRKLAPQVPSDHLIVSESGLASQSDLAALAGSGVRNFLIGESLMRQPDVEAATRMLLSVPTQPEALN